ncbi:MAG: leucine-rich repeat domain-containing protein [Bacteroidales bacterium]|nr:leucine-rich repeat domain-containing protein [Bacteroidales bacterium]
MKKLVVLSVSMLFALAVQAKDFTVDNLIYSTNADSISVSVVGRVNNPVVQIEIPLSVTDGVKSYPVTSIGYRAFNGCWILPSITIPSSVISIGDEAFSGCGNLRYITCQGAIPASVGTDCFFNVDKSLCVLLVPQSAGTAYSSATGWLDFKNILEPGTAFNVTLQEAGTLLAAIGMDNLKKVSDLTITGPINGTDILVITTKLPQLQLLDMENATIVSGGVSYNDYLFTVDNEIGESMFYKMPLKSVILPSSVTSIGYQAFYECNCLTSITMHSGVTSIGDRAFSGCSSLLSVAIPSGVTSIGEDVFNGCSSITSITLPSGITSIGKSAFQNCSALSSFSLPLGVTSIGDGAFWYCFGLTSFTIPTSVTSIGINALGGCSGLTSLTIPSGVSLIGNGAFASCTGLKEIRTLSPTPLTIESGVFDFIDKYACILYVPQGELVDYFVAVGWRDFKNIVEEGLPGKYSINVAENNNGKIFLNDTQVESVATLLDANAAAVFRFEANAGCSLTKVTLDGVDITSSIVNGSYTISSVSKNYSLIATFTENPVYLTIQQAVGGQISQEVKRGVQYTYTIEAASGWSIHTITFNGTDVTDQLDINHTYTTPAIEGDAVLNISYENSGTAVSQTRAGTLKVYTATDAIVIEGAEYGEEISVCTESGALIQRFNAVDNVIRITVPQNAVYLIKTPSQTVKVAL